MTLKQTEHMIKILLFTLFSVCLLLLLLLLGLSVKASEHYEPIIYQPNKYSINHYYDGDTVYVDFKHPNIPDIFVKNVGIRILGVDTPEIRGSCEEEKRMAKVARDFLKDFVTRKDVELWIYKRDKYYRLDGDFYDPNAQLFLSDALLVNDLAYSYDGQRAKEDWCETP